MPQCCAVPLCPTRTSGHRFPKDEKLRKKWIVAIRRDKYKPTTHARICNKHFVQSDYVMPKMSVLENPKPLLKKNAVPSKFHWTERQTAPNKQRQEHTEKPLFLKKSLNLSSLLSSPEDSEFVPPRDASTMTYTLTKAFRIEDFQPESKKDELKFYTGFDSYEHFWLIFTILGPAVNHLLYYPSQRPLTVKILTPANEFLLTIVKLRRNMVNRELAYKFDISEALVSSIFITWINFLYCQFKELNIWVPHKILEENLKFKGRSCTSTIIIIDCNEIKIGQPKNPVSTQFTYSSYKSSNTLKVLVGMSCAGNITFVSDAYGGSISDRCLFVKCGLSHLLEKNDIVLADQGFQIQDILSPRDITIKNMNIHEFLKKKADQLEPELNSSKKVSSSRIHIERVIGLAKTYRILEHFTSNIIPLRSRIIFVCFMLANFRKNIERNKNK